jgi:VIT1/CCC1 family predicted Fe2+/Mn2+ transporter
MDGLADLNERFASLRRAVSEVTLVVEALAEMVSASGMAAARDLLTSNEADDVATQMKAHLLNARDALHQANRPTV